MIQAANIITAVRKGGSDARDVRDAAHEVAHVFQVKRASRRFIGTYDRENIHKQLERISRRDAAIRFEVQLVVYEYEARAVEWLVCDALKVPYEVDHWVDIMLIETMSTMGVLIPGGVDENRNRIESYRKRTKTLAIVEKVLALGGK